MSLFNSIEDKYGSAAADRAATLASQGDEYALNAYLSDLRRGVVNPGRGDLNDSTLSNFFELVTTDPLGAPLESLNNQIGNATKSFLRNPWVVALVVAAIAYFAFPYVARLLKFR